MEKMAWDSPKWGQEFPTNPDLANILGRADLDFESLYIYVFPILLIPNFWISRSPDFRISRNLAWAGLGPGLGQR